jgi:serine/threonine-protein kinase HipA
MKALYVYYESELVGRLSEDDDLICGFEYCDAWLSSDRRFALSLAMPLEQRKFGNRLTRSFFENLTPEGEIREHLQRTHGITSDFDFLEQYGRDCAGAIIVTDRADYAHTIDESRVVQIDMSRIYQAIEQRQPVADVIADMDPGYLSLAGAQDKFPAIYDGKTFSLPIQGAPTTHIVKAPIQRSSVKDSVYNEYFCMELARAVDLNVPHCFVIDGTHPLFVVERYDRFRDGGGRIHRIHQQDFCQAHGITSASKYEDKGGPTLKQNYELIRSQVRPDRIIGSLQAFFDWVGFNLLIGNNDSHSKNISFLLRDGRNELAPFYDLVCTAIYPKLKRTFSFKIGDRNDFSRIGGNQMALMEQSLGVRDGTFRARLALLSQKVAASKEVLAEKICAMYPDAKIPRRISEMIDERIRSLRLQGAL